ncbi:hypothetical protein LINPERPRIM_LOCUS39685, partial [Linum perenne]
SSKTLTSFGRETGKLLSPISLERATRLLTCLPTMTTLSTLVFILTVFIVLRLIELSKMTM